MLCKNGHQRSFLLETDAQPEVTLNWAHVPNITLLLSYMQKQSSPLVPRLSEQDSVIPLFPPSKYMAATHIRILRNQNHRCLEKGLGQGLRFTDSRG